MISLIRLEAEASDMDTLLKEIDAAEKALRVSKDLVVHDEHYERVAATGQFKGRRVFKRGAPPVVTQLQRQGTAIASPFYLSNASGASCAITKA